MPQNDTLKSTHSREVRVHNLIRPIRSLHHCPCCESLTWPAWPCCWHHLCLAPHRGPTMCLSTRCEDRRRQEHQLECATARERKLLLSLYAAKHIAHLYEKRGLCGFCAVQVSPPSVGDNSLLDRPAVGNICNTVSPADRTKEHSWTRIRRSAQQADEPQNSHRSCVRNMFSTWLTAFQHKWRTSRTEHTMMRLQCHVDHLEDTNRELDRSITQFR